VFVCACVCLYIYIYIYIYISNIYLIHNTESIAVITTPAIPVGVLDATVVGFGIGNLDIKL